MNLSDALNANIRKITNSRLERHSVTLVDVDPDGYSLPDGSTTRFGSTYAAAARQAMKTVRRLGLEVTQKETHYSDPTVHVWTVQMAGRIDRKEG